MVIEPSQARYPKHGPVHARPAYTVKPRGELGCAIYSEPAGASMQVDCYHATDPTRIIDVFYSEYCAKCSGSGRVCIYKRKLRTLVTCPSCKGKPEIYPDLLVRTSP